MEDGRGSGMVRVGLRESSSISHNDILSCDPHAASHTLDTFVFHWSAHIAAADMRMERTRLNIVSKCRSVEVGDGVEWRQ